MQPRSALLIGASGLIGGHLLRLLLNEELYDTVTVLVRTPLSIRHPKLEEIVTDFDHLETLADVVRGNDIFCCLGTTIRAARSQEAFRRVDFTYVQKVASLASKNGAGQFLLVSSLGANMNSGVFYSRVKGEIEMAVANLPFRSVQIFRPSVLRGERRETRINERFATAIMTMISFLLVGKLRRYRPINASTVAHAMLAAAKQEDNGVIIYESERIQLLGTV